MKGIPSTVYIWRAERDGKRLEIINAPAAKSIRCFDGGVILFDRCCPHGEQLDMPDTPRVSGAAWAKLFEEIVSAMKGYAA